MHINSTDYIRACSWDLEPQRLKSIADKSNIKFVYDFGESPMLFEYNDKYMVRALNHLITNALLYAKSQIILTCRNDGKTLKLSVTDNGEGIPEESLPYIFERFYKGKNGHYSADLASH